MARRSLVRPALIAAPCSSPSSSIAAVPRTVATVSRLAKRPRSGLALTQRTRLRQSSSEEDGAITLHYLSITLHYLFRVSGIGAVYEPIGKRSLP